MTDITTEQDIRSNGGFMEEDQNWNNEGVTMRIIEFDSISNMAAFDFTGRVKTEQGGNTWAYGRHEGYRTFDENREAILMGRSPQAIIDMYEVARDGIESQVEEMIAMMPSARRKRKFGIEGDEISMERIMVHNPEAWEKRVRGQKKQTVRIAINYGYSAGTSDASFIEGAVRGVALADVLQRLGHTVEITAVSFSASGYGTSRREYAINAMLKDSSSPVDPQQLLLTSLPSLSRVFEFGILEVYGQNIVSNMGMRVSQVTDAHVERFGIDVFASGSDFIFKGADKDGHIADTVSKINAMMVSSIDPETTKQMTDMLAQFAIIPDAPNTGFPSAPLDEMEAEEEDEASAFLGSGDAGEDEVVEEEEEEEEEGEEEVQGFELLDVEFDIFGLGECFDPIMERDDDE